VLIGFKLSCVLSLLKTPKLAKNKKGDAFAVLQRRIAFCLKNCKFSANTDHYKMQYSCFF